MPAPAPAPAPTPTFTTLALQVYEEDVHYLVEKVEKISVNLKHKMLHVPFLGTLLIVLQPFFGALATYVSTTSTDPTPWNIHSLPWANCTAIGAAIASATAVTIAITFAPVVASRSVLK